MTIHEIEERIHNTAWTGQPAGLTRITLLLERLGYPQNQLKFIHIAGTNGKGSTAAMLSSVLTAAGYKTGLYTSPHLTHLGERFQIDGIPMTDDLLERVVDEVMQKVDDIYPTEFDLMTAMAFCHFARQQCDIVVLEVGLGGRLDSTNVIPPPEVSVITNIGFDHVALLGDTLGKIATEKAGILKSGSRCVLYHQTDEVMDVVKSVCQEGGIPLTITQPNRLSAQMRSVEGQRFQYCDLSFEMPLLGDHQMHNAMVALEVVNELRKNGWQIPLEAVRQGLGRVQWSGRMELLSTKPSFIVDGGHNAQCLSALMDSLRTLYPAKKFIYLMGILADKNVDEMLDLVLPLAQSVVTITPDSPRALEAQTLASLISARGVEAVAATSVVQGILVAFCGAEEDDVIVAFGSLYTVGEIRDWFLQGND